MMHVTKIKEQKGSYTVFASKSLGSLRWGGERLIVRQYKVNKQGSRWRLNRSGDIFGDGIIFDTLREAVKYTARYDD